MSYLKWSRSGAACALLSVLSHASTSPVIASDQALLAAADPAAFGRYGASVALSYPYAVIGAPGADGTGVNGGAAYVYEHTGGAWSPLGRLPSPGLEAGDDFGQSVDISGDWIIVGAPGDDDQGPEGGAAYLYERGTDGWGLDAKLFGSLAVAGDRFGESVAIEGSSAVVGAYLNDHAGFSSGIAFVFFGGGASWGEQAVLTASDASNLDQFGFAVDIEGDTVLIGAPIDGANALNGGSAYVFTRSGYYWTEQQKLASDASADFDSFGWSVALSQGRIAIGAPGVDAGAADAGAVYLYSQVVGQWRQEARVSAGDPVAGAGYGESVALDGIRCVVGAPRADAFLADVGAAYLLEHDGSAWAQHLKLSAEVGNPSDAFGSSVALQGSHVLVGSEQDDDAFADQGSVTAFTLSFGPPGSPLCFGDGSSGACPCANAGAPGQGCANSTGLGAVLWAEGSPHVSADDLTLHITQGPPITSGIFLQGTQQAAIPFRDGFLCVVGTTRRLEIVFFDAAGNVQSSDPLAATGDMEPGEHIYYQAWYRDGFGPCGTGSNFTNAFEVLWN